MIRYICKSCGTGFDEPVRIRRTEKIGEFRREYWDEYCQICGGEDFVDADICRCGKVKEKADILCEKCRRELKDKFISFADELTAEEEEQLDCWLECASVTDRENWA